MAKLIVEQQINKAFELSDSGRVTDIKLKLGGCNLKEIPEKVFKIRELVDLDLKNNRIEKIPKDIRKLKKLKKLNLYRNQIKSIPQELEELSKLEELYLSNNLLKDFSIDFESFYHLRILDLSHNHLSLLQGNCKNNSIISFLINNNELKELPWTIGQMKKLKKLRASNNKLEKIALVLFYTKSLTELHLDNNEIYEIPKEIINSNSLRILDLSDNKILDLPKEVFQLESLLDIKLASNKIKAIPEEILSNENKRFMCLDFRDNKINLPPEVLEKYYDPDQIINYYSQNSYFLKKGKTRPLRQAKIIIVGQGGVGKTQIVNRLVFNEFNSEEKKTEGIQITKWSTIVKGKEVKLNIWDFGGQEIMHTTHQFFLTRRSLYILVWDARQEDRYGEIDYWLKLIQGYGGDSPAIIVLNKIDQHYNDIDLRGYKSKYPFIKEFVKVSCKENTNIDKLHFAIKEVVDQLELINYPINKTWLSVKDEIELLDKDYMDYTEYEKICDNLGIKEEISQTTLVNFLHDLGVVVNYQDDPRLDNTHILNPQWVTNGVYKILNYRPISERLNGTFTTSELKDILNPSDKYPIKKRQYIVNVMQKFKLCLPIGGVEGKKYLIPDLLPVEEPYISFDYSNALHFQFHYDFFPMSVFSRFVVEMHRHAKKYWRRGVLLEKEVKKGIIKKLRSLIKVDKEDKKVFIWITGPYNQKRQFLSNIRHEFDKIHETLPNINSIGKVPLPNTDNVFIGYKYLEEMEARGRKDIFPEGANEPVIVKDLLDGFRLKNELIANAMDNKILLKRIDDLLKLLDIQYEKIYDFQKELIISASVPIKFELKQKIKEECLPTVRMIETELSELFKEFDFSEENANRSIEEINNKLTLIEKNNSTDQHVELINKIEELKTLIRKPGEPASGKLKAIIPLLPGILKYEFVLDSKNSFKFLWKNMKNRIKKKE